MPKFIYIDLFCGAGGTTTGVELATDENGNKLAKVVACVNHDAKAINSHYLNHPHVKHFTEDIRTLKMAPLKSVVDQARVEHPEALVVLWASLECTNFSNAKGGKPRDADSRTLANHLDRYIHALSPDYIQIENVREFMAWGPLDKNGKPISKKNGKYFIQWTNRVCDFGYDENHTMLNAADFGGYTSRNRLFMIFAKKGLPISFPETTHSKKPHKDAFGEKKAWKPVKEVLNFEEEGNSIFTRKKPLVENTLKRIYAGLVKYVANGDDSFLAKYFSGDPRTMCNSIHQPSGTIKTKDSHSLIQCNWLVKFFDVNKRGYVNPGRSIEDPAPTITTQGRIGLTKINFLTEYYGNGGAKSVDQPIGTITTKDRSAKIQAEYFLDKQYSGSQNHSSIESPAGTVMPSDKHKLVKTEKFLLNPQWGGQGSSVDKPCFTLIARMDKAPPYLIVTKKGELAIKILESDSETMIKIKLFMAHHGIVDIKMRMLLIPELLKIQGFPEDYILDGTKTDQKKFIGNAVHPIVAKHLVINLSKSLDNNLLKATA